jgi:hypothetical protein
MMERNGNFEIVTKLEAAERQLWVAIRLFFERRDAIAVHTLAAAAHSVLVDLARPRGVKIFFEKGKYARPEDKEDNEMLRAAQNFFKHGAKDPNQEHPFFFEMTSLLLYDAALLHWRLTGALSSEVSAFISWYWGKNPDLLTRSKPSPELVEQVKNYARYDFDDILRLLDLNEKERRVARIT